MKTPITKKKLQDHFAYVWWQYLLVAVISVFGWSLIYSVTAYRPPEEKKIVMGVYGFASDANLKAYMGAVQQERLPEMEEISHQIIAPDETYGDMILTTRIAARECDIYILPRAQFQSYSEQAAFMPLDEVLPDLVAELEAAGVSLSRGWRSNAEINEKHLYGIPCSSLPGIQPLLQCDTSDLYISVFYETGNNENVLIFLEGLVRDMLADPAVADAPSAQ